MNWNPAKIIYFVDVRQKLHFKQAFKIAQDV
jgi:arginyl-tRNA synthetase